MRITGGTAKRRKLTGLRRHDLSIRPTSDRVREAIFSIIGKQIAGKVMLDLFAGTGVVGIEALSRGAKQVVFVDNSNNSIDIIGKNLNSCFNHPQARIFKLEITRPAAMHWLRKHLPVGLRFDLVFMDPPYGKDLAGKSLLLLESSALLANRAMVIIEEQANQIAPVSSNCLKLIDQRSYGDTNIWIYQNY